MPSPPEPAQGDLGAEELEDAHRAIGYVSTWITNADTKAGLLATALAVSIVGTFTEAGAVRQVTDPHGMEWLAALVVVLFLMAVAVSIVSLARVITPRTPPPQIPSRFGFPTLSDASWHRAPSSRAEVAAEAWSQAAVLSGIARRKFDALRRASVAVFVSLALCVLWRVIAAFVV